MACESTERILLALRSLPAGRTASYGSIACAAGSPKGARQVVRILNAMAESEALPWWRVIRKDGSIALPRGAGFELQKALLESEGVEVDQRGKIDQHRFGWTF